MEIENNRTFRSIFLIINYINETVYHNEKNSDNKDLDAKFKQLFKNLKPCITLR